MGLDDSLRASKLEDLILSTLHTKGTLEYHTSLTTAEDLKRMEENIVYTGYSVAFHTLKPIATVKAMGESPLALCPEDHDLVDLRVRVAVLEAYLAVDDASARPLLDEARAALAQKLLRQKERLERQFAGH